MKNLIKFMAIIFIIALTAFCFISCPESSGNGNGNGNGQSGNGQSGNGQGTPTDPNPLPPIVPPPSSDLSVTWSGNSTYNFPKGIYEQSGPAPLIITITNKTEDTIKITDIYLNGDKVSTSDFELFGETDIITNGIPGTKSTIRNYVTFEVSPNHPGLEVGNYGDDVIISYPGNRILSRTPISFTVDKADGAKVTSNVETTDKGTNPNFFIIDSISDNSSHSTTLQKLEIGINTIDSWSTAIWGEYGWEYDFDTKKWNETAGISGVKFTGVTLNRLYYFFVRYKDDGKNYKAGDPYTYYHTDRVP